jgi:hypothetical protein
MSQTTHIPGTVVRTSALPEEVPTHVVGVSLVTGRTVKYSLEDLKQDAVGVSQLAALDDVSLSSPTNGQVLIYDAALDLWINTTTNDASTGVLEIDGGTFLVPGGGFSFDGGNF